RVDGLGYGLRVPGLVVSPYAKQGFIDHQVLSFDAYLKFIEDDFLGGRRLDPKTDGRPPEARRPRERRDSGEPGSRLRLFPVAPTACSAETLALTCAPNHSMRGLFGVGLEYTARELRSALRTSVPAGAVVPP